VKFPGGVGAEVGIYTRKPPWDQIDRPPIGTLQPLLAEEEQQPSEPLIDVPVAMSQWWERMRADIRSPDPFKIWWPDKNAVADSGSPVSFSLYDRNFGDALTKEYSTPTYWMCKWMATPSFNGANNTTDRDR
jgi:hypothetical protein